MLTRSARCQRAISSRPVWVTTDGMPLAAAWAEFFAGKWDVPLRADDSWDLLCPTANMGSICAVGHQMS